MVTELKMKNPLKTSYAMDTTLLYLLINTS